MITGSAIGRGCKMRVTESSAPATRRQPTLAVRREIMQQFAGGGREDLGTNRHADDHVISIMSRSIAAFTMQSAPGSVFGVIT